MVIPYSGVFIALLYCIISFEIMFYIIFLYNLLKFNNSCKAQTITANRRFFKKGKMIHKTIRTCVRTKMKNEE